MVHTLKVVCASVEEIRRFTVNDDIISHYDLLCEKILKHFPSLKGKSLQVGWIDSESDYVVMSTDEELAQAVANSDENGLMKVYVRMAKDPETAKPKTKGVLHPHVMCDHCEGPVYGYRFKCLECFDYDLCTSCHSEGHHPDHNMLRITSPNKNNITNLLHAASGIMCSVEGISAENLRKCDDKKENDIKMTNENKSSYEPCLGTNEILRKIVQQKISPLLNSMGIDLEIRLPEDKSQESEGVKGNVTNNQSEEKKESIGSSSAEMSSGDKSNPNVPDAQPKPPVSPKTADVMDSEVQEKDEEWTVLNASVNEKCLNNNNSSSNVNYETANPTPPPPVATTAPLTEPKVADSFPHVKVVNAVKDEMPVWHPDENVRKALMGMRNMGFTNEGGWLVRLLEAKKGNINDVLDALYPSRQ